MPRHASWSTEVTSEASPPRMAARPLCPAAAPTQFLGVRRLMGCDWCGRPLAHSQAVHHCQIWHRARATRCRPELSPGVRKLLTCLALAVLESLRARVPPWMERVVFRRACQRLRSRLTRRLRTCCGPASCPGRSRQRRRATWTRRCNGLWGTGVRTVPGPRPRAAGPSGRRSSCSMPSRVAHTLCAARTARCELGYRTCASEHVPVATEVLPAPARVACIGFASCMYELNVRV